MVNYELAVWFQTHHHHYWYLEHFSYIDNTYFSPKNFLQNSAASAFVIRKLSPWNCPLGKIALISANMWLNIKDSFVRFLLQREGKQIKHVKILDSFSTTLLFLDPSSSFSYMLFIHIFFNHFTCNYLNFNTFKIIFVRSFLPCSLKKNKTFLLALVGEICTKRPVYRTKYLL